MISLLTGKISGIIIFCIACLSIILLPIAIVQTVRLNGVTFLGWHIVDGAIAARDIAYQARDKAESDLRTSQGNQTRLEAGLKQCNGSIDNLAKTGVAITAAADKLIAAAAKGQTVIKGNIDAIRAIQSTGEKCPAADAILSRGFQ